MKTVKELREIMGNVSFCAVDAHVHTHLCDGAPDMTVENIAQKAESEGMQAVILTPHFHKHVSDETHAMYPDSDEDIFIELRKEIDAYHKNYPGKVTVLLSTEADILDAKGHTALTLTEKGEQALDLVTPTVNYHPLLPLKAVSLTSGMTIVDTYESGAAQKYLDGFGGTAEVLKSLYEAETNAISACPYPAMVGHFLAAHSSLFGYNWFDAKPAHLELMKEGAGKLVGVCAEKGAMIDATGIQMKGLNFEEKAKADGFLCDFQKWFLKRCKEKNVLVFPGSDAHNMSAVGDVAYYQTLI